MHVHIPSRAVSLLWLISLLLSVPADSDQVRYYKRSFAIVIGVNDYYTDINLPPLATAANDARDVGALLVSDFGYAPDQVLILDRTGIDASSIKRTLEEWLLNKAPKEDDSILFYFSGHGKMLLDGTGYIAGTDAEVQRVRDTWVSIAWLVSALRRYPSRHKAIILDSCFSGSLFTEIPSAAIPTAKDLASPYPAGSRADILAPLTSTGEVSRPRSQDNYSYYLDHPAFVGMSAGRLRSVPDAWRPGAPNSPFTTVFLKVLRERADSVRRDHAFTFRQAAARIEAEVANNYGSSQIPNWGLVDRGDGDFLFRPVVDTMTPTEQRITSLRMTKYSIDMQAAFQALHVHKLERTNELLERNLPSPGQPDVRGFEWNYLWNAIHSEDAVFFARNPPRPGIASNVVDTAISPDGLLVLLTSADNDDRDGRLTLLGRGDRSASWTLRFELHRVVLASASAGRMFAVASADEPTREHLSRVELFDDMGSIRASFAAPALVRNLYVAENNSVLMAIGDEWLRLWSLRTGGVIVTRRAQANAGALAPDGKVYALAFDTLVEACYVDKGRCVRLPLRSVDRHGRLSSAARAVAEPEVAPTALTFVSNRRVAIGKGGQILLWDPTTNEVSSIETHTDVVSHSLRTAGDFLVSLHAAGEMLCISVRDKAIVRRLFVADELGSRRLATSASGLVAVADTQAGTTRLWTRCDTDDGPFVFDSKTFSFDVAYSGSGAVLANLAGDNVVDVWNTNTWKRQAELKCPDFTILRRIALSDEGDTIAISGYLRDEYWTGVSLLQVANGSVAEKRWLIPSLLENLRFRPGSGNLVGSQHQAGNPGFPDAVSALHVIDLAAGSDTILATTPEMLDISFSRDGNKAVAATVKNAPYFSSGNLASWSSVPAQHDQPVSSAGFLDRERSIVSSSFDGTTLIYSTERKDYQRALVAHNTYVQKLSVADDGRTFATASDDGAIRLWNSSGDAVGSLPVRLGNAQAISFSASTPGTLRAAIAGTAYTWRSASDVNVESYYERLWEARGDALSCKKLMRAVLAVYSRSNDASVRRSAIDRLKFLLSKCGGHSVDDDNAWFELFDAQMK